MSKAQTGVASWLRTDSCGEVEEEEGEREGCTEGGEGGGEAEGEGGGEAEGEGGGGGEGERGVPGFQADASQRGNGHDGLGYRGQQTRERGARCPRQRCVVHSTTHV